MTRWVSARAGPRSPLLPIPVSDQPWPPDVKKTKPSREAGGPEAEPWEVVADFTQDRMGPPARSFQKEMGGDSDETGPRSLSFHLCKWAFLF